MGKEEKTDVRTGESGGDGGAPERTSWDNQLEFFFSCVGYAVGLGNIWRFPYLTFKYGGGAFLIPYVIMLIICGLPLFFLELAFGQFASLGPITIWRICPLFTGLGVAVVLISLMVCVYYNMIVTYGIFYLLASLLSLDDTLPWASCDNSWNTKYCMTQREDISNMTESNAIISTKKFMDEACINKTMMENNVNATSLTLNFTKGALAHCDMATLPSEEYFVRYVLRLQEATDMGDLGSISIKMIFLLALAWLILFYSLRKGVETSGKVVYFMATFPYVVLIALFIRGITLDGHMEGINFYIIPEWDKLTDVNVWRTAAIQIFFSLGPAFGTLITMSSYNPFRHNCYRDAIVVAIINCSTSIFAGFVIFSMLGYMAQATGQSIQNVTSDGPGLVFVVYPEGISHMPGAPIWAFLFFFMLIALGLDTQFAMFETVISAIVDEFPEVLRKHRVLFTGVCHIVGFLLGIPMVTKGGMWVLTLMDNYSASYSVMFCCLCELIALNYIYGNQRLCEDIEMMLGFQPNWYWRGCWMFVTPIALVLMLIASGVQYKPVGYGDYEFEDWVQGVGFAMVGVPIVTIFLGAAFKVCQYGSLKEAVKPSPEWGPAKAEHRTGRYAMEATNAMENGGFEMDEVPERVTSTGYKQQAMSISTVNGTHGKTAF